MMKSITLLAILIGLTAIGYFYDFYDFKTLIIIVVAIVIGGYFGGKFLTRKKP